MQGERLALYYTKKVHRRNNIFKLKSFIVSFSVTNNVKCKQFKITAISFKIKQKVFLLNCSINNEKRNFSRKKNNHEKFSTDGVIRLLAATSNGQ